MFVRRVGFCAALIVAALVGSACAATGDSESVVAGEAVTDSAGVRIVTHSIQGAALDAVPEWSVTGSPDWTFSRIPGRRNAELLGVTGAAFLRNGLLVLGHGSDRELLFVDQSGSYLRSSGSSGSGPGQMRAVRGPFVSADNWLVVYDPRQRRIMHYDSMGGSVKSQTVAAFSTGDTAFFIRTLVGAQADRRALFELTHEASRDADGAINTNTQLASLDGSGQWQLIGPSRAAPSLSRHPPGASGALGAGMSPLAPRTIDVVCGNDIVTTSTHDFTVNRSSDNGALQLSIRTDLQPRRASVQDFALEMGRPFTAEQMQSPEMQLAVQQMSKQFSNAEAPIVSGIHCDEQRNIYTVLAETPTQTERRVLVFGANGALRAQFSLPTDWRLLAIQSNRMAVLRHDADDLESVNLYRVQPFARD